MKKIAFITPGILPVPPVKGGAVENLVYNLIKENEKNGTFKVDVYGVEYKSNSQYCDDFQYTNFVQNNNTKNIIARLKISGIASLVNKKFVAYPYLLNVIKKLKTETYDAIIVENRLEFVDPIKKICDSKIYLHLHNDYLTQKNNINKRTLRIVDKVIVVSNYIKEEILKTWGNGYNSKIHVLHNGIDIEHFARNKEDKIINNDKFTILFHGRINKDKGIDILLESLRLVKNKNISLIVVGSTWYGDNKEDEFMKSLKKLVDLIDIDVKFTGYIDYLKIPEILGKADLIVLPSVWNDPFPLVILEAMASGKIIISTNSGGIPEAIDKAGIILDKNLSRDKLIENLANTIENVINNYNSYKIMGSIAQERSFSMFTKETMFVNFMRIINE